MDESLLAKSARGSAYNIAVSAVTILLGFTRSVLLMRLLGPEQFGAVALSLFFATFLAPFSSLGLDGALIQKKDASPGAFSTHFILRLVGGAAVLALGALAAPALRRLYPGLVVDIFLILLVVNLFEASFATPGVVLRREMRFGAIAALNLAASLAMTVTAPLLAYLGAGVWSLVAEQAVGPAVRWLGVWGVLRPWRLRFGFDREEARSSVKFGSQVLSANLLGILLDRFDDFWTGSVLGTAALGYYSRAYEIAQYPERVLATPVTNVFFSTYAALQENRTELSRAFFRSSSFLVRAGFLLAVVLLGAAPEVTLILFGATWLPIVPVFRLLLVYVLLDPFYTNLSYLLVGVGQPGLLTRVRVLQAGLFVGLVVVLARLAGMRGVALAADLMMLSGTLALVAHSRRFTRYSLRRMFVWPLAAAGLAALASWALAQALSPASLWGSLLLKAGTAAAIYALVLYLAERRTIHALGRAALEPAWNRLRLLF
jgi:PST family polysaccharide transporter